MFHAPENAHSFISSKTHVGVPGIEPGFYAPEAYIMPLYDTPTWILAGVRNPL